MAACSLCGEYAVVQWQRRPTDGELAAQVALIAERDATIALLADPQLLPPVPMPVPTAADTTVAVYACAAHAITIDLAAYIHAGTCSAPNTSALPNCDCTPEIPAPVAVPSPVNVSLPAGWQ